MERWRGKIAVVTGASAGIGLAIVKTLLREGMTVVGLARRKNKMLNELKNVEGTGKFFAQECDVSKEKDIEEAFNSIRKSFQTIHVLINNAGIAKTKSVEEADIKEIQEIINVNVVGVVHCSKLAIKLMKENGSEGHIISINSVAGHKVPKLTLPDGAPLHLNVYSPTKYAVTSFSEVLANELLGGKIRVTSLSPGYVSTNLGANERKDDALEEFKVSPSLNPEDIANAIAYILGTPPHVQITELTIRPLAELF